MGYELHVTRREFWSDEGPDISLEEWKSYAAADSEMRMDNYAEATTEAGAVVRTEMDGLAVWTRWSKDGVDGGKAWIYWFEGNLTSKSPDREFRRKIFRIALALNAKCQGDDGELYGADGEMIEDAAEIATRSAHRSPDHPKRPWWKII